jgi:hypothetical protein
MTYETLASECGVLGLDTVCAVPGFAVERFSNDQRPAPWTLAGMNLPLLTVTLECPASFMIVNAAVPYSPK